MGRPKTKDSRIVHMRMDLRVYNRLNAYAEQEKKAVTTAVEQLVTESLDNKGFLVPDKEQEDA